MAAKYIWGDISKYLIKRHHFHEDWLVFRPNRVIVGTRFPSYDSAKLFVVEEIRIHQLEMETNLNDFLRSYKD